MKIDELRTVDFNNHWLICTRYGEISTAPKDPLWIRWIKTIFKILTFFYYDVYGHVRINRVAVGLFEHFKHAIKKSPHCKANYIEIIDHLLETRKHPIRTYRKELIDLRNKILFFKKNN